MPLFLTRSLTALLLIPAGRPQSPTLSPVQAPAIVHSLPASAQESTYTESLRKDIAQHPGDFMVFATQGTAEIFILTHTDAFSETDRRVVQRGIMGYWKGKTLVVIPGSAN